MEEKIVRTGCGVILINDLGQILLGKRNDDPTLADSEMHEEGTWSLPGGNIEYGESFYEAGMREEVEFYLEEVHGVENPDPELVNEIVEEIADSSKVTQAIDECSVHIIKNESIRK